MKRVINMVLAGEPVGQLFIPIVRYVLPSEDHDLQKLLLLYMETIQMTDAKVCYDTSVSVCRFSVEKVDHRNEF